MCVCVCVSGGGGGRERERERERGGERGRTRERKSENEGEREPQRESARARVRDREGQARERERDRERGKEVGGVKTLQDLICALHAAGLHALRELHHALRLLATVPHSTITFKMAPTPTPPPTPNSNRAEPSGARWQHSPSVLAAHARGAEHTHRPRASVKPSSKSSTTRAVSA